MNCTDELKAGEITCCLLPVRCPVTDTQMAVFNLWLGPFTVLKMLLRYM